MAEDRDLEILRQRKMREDKKVSFALIPPVKGVRFPAHKVKKI
jgi:hypothetical protein